MRPGINLRLSLMMALTYAVQGAFWPLLAVHMKDQGVPGPARGWVFSTLAIGSIAMPLGAGRLVDRFFPAQRVLAAIFAVASGLLALLATGRVTGPGPLFALFLVFWLVTAPAFALAGAIALRNLPRPAEQFPRVRLGGTVGWMAVGWLVSLVMTWSGSTGGGRGAYEASGVAAVLAAVLAVYALTLPNTPPLPAPLTPGAPAGPLRGAWALARRPGMTGFLVTALGVHLTTPFVYQVLPSYLAERGMSRSWVSTAMTLGQWPEILTLAALPWLLARLGTKGTLALGIGAWVVRFGSLATAPPLWVAVAGIPLHGVGTACFTIVGQLYTDSRAAGDGRAGAQALYTVVTSGIGSFSGSLLAGGLTGRLGGRYDAVFLVPCVIDLALIVYFCAGFRPNVTTKDCAGASDAARPFRTEAVRGQYVRVGSLVTESADG